MDRRTTTGTFIAVIVLTSLVYIAKDIYGVHHLQIGDIRDHYLVVQALFDQGQFIMYDTGPTAIFAPPFMHLMTGIYNTFVFGGTEFDFFFYRDNSFILWHSFLGLYAGLLFLIIRFFSREKIPVHAAAILSIALAVSAGQFNLFRWYGAMQFFGVLTLTTIMLAAGYFTSYRSHVPRISLLTALIFLVSLNHYTSAFVVIIGVASASIATVIGAGKKRAAVMRTVIVPFFVAGSIATVAAVAFFYRLLLTQPEGSWGEKIITMSNITDLFSWHIARSQPVSIPLLGSAIIIGSMVLFLRYFRKQTHRRTDLWGTFFSYFVYATITTILCMVALSLFLKTSAVPTELGSLQARRTVIGLLLARTYLFLPLVLAVLGSRLVADVQTVFPAIGKRMGQFLRLLAYAGSAAVLVVSVWIFAMDVRSMNASYLLQHHTVAANAQVAKMARRSEPSIVPLQKSPASSLFPNSLLVVWPQNLADTETYVRVTNNETRDTAYEWHGTNPANPQSIYEIDALGSGTYTIEAYTQHPEKEKPQKFTRFEKYVVLSPLQFLVFRIMLPLCFVLVIVACTGGLLRCHGLRPPKP